ncbi:MAG: CHAT domain-containing tetratricopeptide repeat protein [Ginsengibacter sp.]
MMHKLFFLLVFFINCNYCIGQNINYQDSLTYYYKKSDFNNAIFWSKKNVEKNKNAIPINDSAYGASLNDLALLYREAGDYKMAEALYLQSMEIRKRWGGTEHPEYAGSLLNIADLYERTGRYNEAIMMLQKALEIYKKRYGEQNSFFASALNNLANIYLQLQNLPVADSLLAKSLVIRKKVSGEDSREYAQSLNSIATLYYNMSNFSVAKNYFSKAIDIYKKYPEDSVNYASAILNLGEVHIHLGNPFLGKDMIEEANQIFRKKLGENHPTYALSLIPLSDAYLAMGNNATAEKFIKEAINIFSISSGKNNSDYIALIERLGDFYYQTGKYRVALPYLLECRTLQAKITGELNTHYTDLLNEIASTYQKTGNNSLASTTLIHSLEIEKKLLLNKLDFLSENELSEYVKSREYYFRNYFFPFAFSFDSDSLWTALYNNHLLFSGITLQNTANLSRQLEESKDTLLLSLWKDYQTNKYLLTKTESLPISKRAQSIDSLTVLTNSEEKNLLRKSAFYRDIKTKLNVNFDEVRSHLKPSEAALEFIKVKSLALVPKDTVVYTYMLVLPNKKEPYMFYPFGEKQLQAALKKFAYKTSVNIRGINDQSDFKNDPLPGNDVFKLVWQRLDKYLADTKTIYLSLDGLLNNIAFAAIPIGSDSLLCDKYNLIQVTSTRQVAIEENENKIPSSAALFGGINYNNQVSDSTTAATKQQYYVHQQYRGGDLDSFNFLPNTLKEVKAIKKDMDLSNKKTFLFSGQNATEAAFRSMAKGNASPEIIHFATHGFTFPDSMQQKNDDADNAFKISGNPLLRCGLIMAGGNNGWKGKTKVNEDDGILTGLEISSVSLQNTQLAILSACETGTGELRGSDGVYGLQRAFKLAGVNYVMATLWQVPDKETNEFMQCFYKNLLGGKSIRQSFILTQKTMRKKYAPYYWAAFTLVQ